MDTFSPSIAPQSAEPSHKARTNVNNFGEGYEQDLRLGINAVYVESMSLAWPVLDFAQATEIAAWFTDHVGKTFLWTLPGESAARKWKCDTWEPKYEDNGASCSATLREVFA